MIDDPAPDAVQPEVGQLGPGADRFAFVAHELRNLLNTAMLAFDVMKTGNVGVSGSTAAVLERSLVMARALVSRSLAEVRLDRGVTNRESIVVAQFIEELAPVATLVASAQDVRLMVLPVDAALTIEADRQILAAVLMNLLQNAVKFTRPESTVTVRVDTAADRVRLHVQDECGGLPPGDPDELFQPFEQRSANRTGSVLAWRSAGAPPKRTAERSTRAAFRAVAVSSRLTCRATRVVQIRTAHQVPDRLLWIRGNPPWLPESLAGGPPPRELRRRVSSRRTIRFAPDTGVATSRRSKVPSAG